MKVFALADAHLSLATPGKEMDRFGEQWRDHAHKIAANWLRVVAADDLVLVGGDTSWAMRWEDARADLEFLNQLPGRKVLIRGNHDYWWSTLTKVRTQLPASFTPLDGGAIAIGDVGVCGTRLWECPGLSFAEIQAQREDKIAAPEEAEQSLKIWRREVQRLGRALEGLKMLHSLRRLQLRIALVHYPPCDWRLAPNEVTSMFENAGIDHVVFGQLHGVRPPGNAAVFGKRAGVHYHLTACDFLDFTPKFIAEI